MQQCLQPLVSQRPPPSGARPVCHGGHQRSPRVVATSASYTAVDSKLAFRTFSPQVLNVDNLLAGEGANVGQIRQVQQECAATGFLAIQGHGIPAAQLQQLFATAKQLFDLPLQDKMRLTVQDMQAGRGFEISPEHKSYMQEFASLYGASRGMPPGSDYACSSGTASGASATSSSSSKSHSSSSTPGPCTEPSALCGILSERFCCGPEFSTAQLQDTYYTSELGRVFFPPNAWPTAWVPELQPQMLECYSQCEAIAAALMKLFAAALGFQPDFFQDKLARHHSNMQVANYPSQLLPIDQLRKKAHVDSGTLTILAADHWLPGSSWRAGDGGLQLLSPQQEWLEVQVPPGALLVNLGGLMTRWTNGLWQSTLHRVTNPSPGSQGQSRRLSMAFFHKPAYDALIEVLPACYGSSSGSSGDALWLPEGVQLPDQPLFEPAVVGDLTRQGVLHKLRHLPAEEASAKYHEILASMRIAREAPAAGQQGGRASRR